MSKHGDDGLGYEIVKAVNNGEIIEPLTYEKIKIYCSKRGLNATKNHMRVILSNASANNHSPNYKKYFERIARGEYVILPKFKKQQRYFWLNVDSNRYKWSFSEAESGKQTYSNLNPNGNKRKNERAFEDIKVGDFVVAYETGFVKAITSICKVVKKYEEKIEIFIDFQKIDNYEKGLDWEKLKDKKELKDCDIVLRHQGTLFEVEKKHYNVIVQMLEEINTSLDPHEELYEEVQKSFKDNRISRKKRLENRISLYPEIYEVTTKAFKRNADVIAEVLIRANGICEKCNKKAPFNRAKDGTPYLEVHHLKRLIDGGEDGIKNTIAVCPNCHRELHYG
ncbi:HNH endonuclease [Fictibacillus halophilus]|uniref:HNH endonuclease n=1 Tax=Fictibacillus halophilus TaxID=1610490 RepID=UPI001CFB7B3D|nr:HNH endonuclease signature motif containing protein [Fictibacillus halophilus]